MINFEDFEKIDLRIGKILEAEKVEKSQKLIKIIVDLGEEKRQIVSGIAESFAPEELIGKEIVVLANLEPRKLMGIESQGMLLAVDIDNKTVLLKPENDVVPGSKIS